MEAPVGSDSLSSTRAATEVDEDLTRLESDIRQLKIQYEQYFGGGKKRPPQDVEWRIEQTAKRYGDRGAEMNYAQRFRYGNLMQTYTKCREIFHKRLQRHEEGVRAAAFWRRGAHHRSGTQAPAQGYNCPICAPGDRGRLLRPGAKEPAEEGRGTVRRISRGAGAFRRGRRPSSFRGKSSRSSCSRRPRNCKNKKAAATWSLSSASKAERRASRPASNPDAQGLAPAGDFHKVRLPPQLIHFPAPLVQ